MPPPTQPLSTLVLSVDIGAGHRRAAEALCQAIAELRPGSRHRVVEAMEHLGPDHGKLAREMYFGAVESAPGTTAIWNPPRGLSHCVLARPSWSPASSRTCTTTWRRAIWRWAS